MGYIDEKLCGWAAGGHLFSCASEWLVPSCVWRRSSTRRLVSEKAPDCDLWKLALHLCNICGSVVIITCAASYSIWVSATYTSMRKLRSIYVSLISIQLTTSQTRLSTHLQSKLSIFRPDIRPKHGINLFKRNSRRLRNHVRREQIPKEGACWENQECCAVSVVFRKLEPGIRTWRRTRRIFP